MIEIGNVVLNEKITDKHKIYSMWISSPQIAQSAKSGQIVHVQCDSPFSKGHVFTLRRPISICQKNNDMIRLCYEVRGDGTEWMSNLKKGDAVSLLGASGNGFDVSDDNLNVLLVGGGIGIYPLLSVAEIYKEKASVVLGFRTKSLVNLTEDFKTTGADLKVATDDGSYEHGYKGYVTDVVKDVLNNKKIDLIMACGPKIMMKSIASEAEKRGIRCQVSMEERMACGVGACLACVCKMRTEDKHSGQKKKRVCIDGPVMDGTEVDWND